MLWVLNLEANSTFVGDLIVAVYLLVLPSISVILGGFSSGNPLAILGSSREMKLVLSYELPFLLAMLTVVSKTGSVLIGGITGYQAVHGMLIAQPSCILAFIVSLMAVQAKLAFVPFDIPEAEQEIAGGPFIDYSGPLLAIFKLTKAMLYATLPVLLITLFFGGISLNSPSVIWHFVLKYVLIIVLVVLIKNTNPRVRIDHALRFFWGPMFFLAIAGFILSLLGV